MAEQTLHAVTVAQIMASLALHAPSTPFAVIDLATNLVMPFQVGENTVTRGPLDGQTVVLIGVDLTQHRAKVKAEALREAVEDADADAEFRDPLRIRADWLLARADAIEVGEPV